ncbi:hypothetical protein [Roseibium algae]|uniref:Uncharacterized protein n=1 Tax=Roseibium algae TaxID=3123038 RepID=A0ABU8TQ75_9HYPH
MIDDFSKTLTFQLSKASSDIERMKILKTAFHDIDSLPQYIREHLIDSLRDDVKSEVIDDIKCGLDDDSAEEIKEYVLQEYGPHHSEWVSSRDKITNLLLKNALTSLEGLYETLRSRNQNESIEEILGKINYSQLLAVLKTLIVELEAPAIDRGRVRQGLYWFTKLTRKSAEKEISEDITGALGTAKKSFGDLIKNLDSLDSFNPFS